MSRRNAPDGERAATAGDDRRVLVWEARSGRLLATLEGLGGEVLDAAFGPDGELLATTCADGRVRLWDVHLEGRSSREIGAKVRCRVPYRLEGQLLLPEVPEASACAE